MNNTNVNEADEFEDAAHITYDEYQELKKACEELLGKAKAAARLAENPDFREIVMGSYFEQEPMRLAGLMATGRLSDKQFDGCVSELKAIGSLRTFLQDFIQKGNIASNELADLEEAWEEAVKENSTINGEIV